MRMPLISDIVLFVVYGHVCVGLVAPWAGEIVPLFPERYPDVLLDFTLLISSV